METLDHHVLERGVTIPRDQIHLAAFNPPSRKRGIAALAKELEIAGQLQDASVVKVGARYLLADGHRRLAALGRNGISSIRATIYDPKDLDPEQMVRDLYRSLNTPGKAVSDKDRVASMLGEPKLSFGPRYQRTVDTLRRLYPTPEEQRWLIEKEVGSNILQVAKNVVTYCFTDLVEDTPKHDEKVRFALAYLVNFGAQNDARIYMRAKYSRNDLWGCVKNAKPLAPVLLRKMNSGPAAPLD